MDALQTGKRTIPPCARAIAQETGTDDGPTRKIAHGDAFLAIFLGIHPAEATRQLYIPPAFLQFDKHSIVLPFSSEILIWYFLSKF